MLINLSGNIQILANMARSTIFGLCGHGLNCLIYIQKLCVSQVASMENSNFFEYFESNYSALLSDKKANEVASCRY